MASERHYLPTNCCFVFSIRTGAIILAVLGIFGGGMNIISESYGLAVMAPDIETYIDRYRNEILDDCHHVYTFGWICRFVYGFCSCGSWNTWWNLNSTFAILYGHAIFDFGILFLVCGPSCLFGN